MSDKLPLNPKTEIFHWGPIPGRFFYVSIFTQVNYKYFCQKYLGQNWSRSLFLFQEGRMRWINEYPALRRSGLRVFKKYMQPQNIRHKIYREWQGYITNLSKWHKKIDNTNLSHISDKKLLSIWVNYHREYIKFWVAGTVPELGNYGVDKYLENTLQKYIKNRRELAQAIEILTAPTKMSFYQEEEVALAKTKNITKHQKKYFWLKNSYAGTQVLPVSFFIERKKELKPRIFQEIKERLKKVRVAKEELKHRFKLPRRVMNVVEAISDNIAWQDERKKNIFIILHYQVQLLRQVAKRFGYNFDDLLNAWFWEVEEIMHGKDYHQILEKRGKCFGVDFYKDYRMLNTRETEHFWQIYAQEKVKDGVIKGLVVSKGTGEILTGRVKILLDPTAISTFKSGEILIAPMTSPEYIFAMKKARAIITDAGGLTSHAAIVSRELGIPCIVGTKVATSILKDGDLIKVDVKKGIVFKINSYD